MHPDVAALMAGAGAGGPPQSIQVDPSQHPDSPKDSPSFEDAIQSVLDDLRTALQAPDASAQDKLTVEKITTMLQSIHAQREKEHDAALGGGPATNFLKRASAS